LFDWERKEYPKAEFVGGELKAIWVTNCLKTGVGDEAFSLNAARLNHPCVPNCYAAENLKLERLTLHAIRKIQKREELLICYYIDRYLLKPRDERQQGLKACFDFECTCRACDVAQPSFQQHENKRVQYANRTREPDFQKAAANEKIVKDTILLMEQLSKLTWRNAEL
jgi:hypothetical protein